MRTSRSNKKGPAPTWLFIAIIAVLAAIFCVSAYFLIDYIIEERSASAAYEKLETEVHPEAPEASADASDIAPDLAPDHAALKRINPDYAFWLELDGSVINYPVVAGAGNSHYLTHLFSGEKNANGCLFVDERCEEMLAPLTNTLVHGHRMNSGSMFGSLNNFLNEDYAAAHSEFTVSTPAGDFKGKVFAAYKGRVAGDYLTASFADEDEAAEYINAHIEESAVDFGVTPNANAPIVTLATCVKHNDNERMIVMMTLEEIY